MIKNFKRILHEELSSTLSSVFFGTLFSMIVQGVAFGLFIYAFSDYDALYLGMATGFMTAIPVVGTYIVAVPLLILELLNQNYIFAGAILLFAILILSGFIDNFLRLMFMRFLNKKFALNYSLNELFILLAMIAGVGVFGGWGIIIAPAILSLCVAVLDIYKKSKISQNSIK
jgi:predicted PurR-regulated permease PerM